MTYTVQWCASLLLKKNYKRLMQKNAFFLQYFNPDIKKVREYKDKDNNEFLRLQWKKNGKNANIKLNYIKAMNEDDTIQWFKTQTLRLSNFTAEQFESIIPIGEEDI